MRKFGHLYIFVSNYSKIPIVVSKNKESTKQLLKSRNKKETLCICQTIYKLDTRYQEKSTIDRIPVPRYDRDRNMYLCRS